MKAASWWVTEDWNAVFDLGTNVLVHLLVLIGLLKYVIGIPDEFLFGRILPAAAVLSYFGFIHGATVGIGGGLGMAPSITVAYVAVAAILYWCNGLTTSANEGDVETASS